MKDIFFEAITGGNIDRVKAMLDEDPSLVNLRSANGLSALMTACYYHEPGIASLLEERGANLDLYEAAALGRAGKAAAILDAQPALLDEFSGDGFQAVHLAAFFGQQDVMELLLARGARVNDYARNNFGVQPLHSAVAAQNLPISRMLLEHGADVNARQAEDYTPLMEAAQNGQNEMVDLLLAHGADPTARRTNGLTASQIAAQHGHAELAERLA